MPTFYSEQLTRQRAVGNQFSNGLTEIGPKKRIQFFSILTTGMVANDTVELASLPKGSRILGGQLITEALGASCTIALGTDVALTQGASATAIAAGAANLLAATSVASASNTAFAATFALGAGAVTDAAGKLIATVAGANPTTAKNIQGWVEYVQN